jgi:hypothetical protein
VAEFADGGEQQGLRLNSESVDSFAPARLKLAVSLAVHVDHWHCLVLAPATLAALPSTRAISHTRVFYIAFPISSIRPLGLPIYVARVRAAPLKLARVPACSPLPVTALSSMSLIPSAPFASRLFDNGCAKSETLKETVVRYSFK